MNRNPAGGMTRVCFAITALWALAGCGGGSRSALVPPGLEPFVPGDAIALAVADLAALRETAVWRRYAHGANLPGLDRMVASAGIDPRTGLDRLLVASDGKNLLTAAEGKFESEKVRAAMTKTGAAAETYSGAEVWKVDGRSIAILGGRAVAGDTAAVRAALDRAKAHARLPASIAAMTRAIPAGKPIWGAAAAGFRFSFPDRSNWRNLNRILGGLQSARAWADAGDGIGLEATGECETEDAAGKLSRQLMGLIGMGRLSVAADQKDLLQAFDAIAVTKSGASVQVRVDLSAPVLEAVAAAARQGAKP
ncbi:MAG: hypothetical protein R2762_05675 [Bryobacteraceae bacterium]